MNRLVLKAACATALLSASVCIAAPKAKVVVKPLAPAADHTASAIEAALTELARSRDAMPFDQWVDQLPNFAFSPKTTRLLSKQFGPGRLVLVKRVSAPAGMHNYTLTVPERRYAAATGVLSWSQLDGTLSVQDDARTLVANGSWKSLDWDDKASHAAVRDMTMASTSHRTTGDLWYGDVNGEVGSIEVTTKATGAKVTMDGLFAKVSVTDEPETLGLIYDVGIRAIEAAGQRVDDLRMTMRVTGIDKAAMEAFQKLNAKLSARDLTPEQRRAAAAPIMRELGKAMIAQGATVELDDLHLSYAGSTARLTGKLHLENATEADLDQPELLVKKIVGHAEARVPLAMLRAATTNIARQSIATNKLPMDAAGIDKVAEQSYESMLRQATGSGHVRIDGDMLVTTVDFRDGALLVNGKPFDLPSHAAPVAGVDNGGGAQSMLQPRRIAESCTLPDYPQDIVVADRALAMSMRLAVNADGTVSGVTLARSSGSPDYDKAVLAAAARCKYIPALSDGKPVAVPTVWDVVRAPGTARP